MSKRFVFLAVLAACVLFAVATKAETRVLTFDSNNWGTSVWGTFNTTKKFLSTGGNPGACVRFHGISGVGGSFANQGFTGDFEAQGFSRIGMDIRTVQWFLRPDNVRPRGFIFARYDNGYWPWAREIDDFDPKGTEYRNYFVDFDPNWTDAEAQAHGWAVVTGSGSGSTTSFSETMHHVYQTGFWAQDLSAGAECAVLVDNWRLGPQAATAKPLTKPRMMEVKPMLKARPLPPTVPRD